MAGRAAHGDGDHDGVCANCGTALVGAYCHACGQSGHVHRTADAFIHEIGHGVFHFEGKVWRTLPLLAWRPGELTRRYVNGERVRFVSPIALFLFAVFLMFASLNLISHGLDMGGLNRRNFTEVQVKVVEQRKLAAARIAELEGKRAKALASPTGAADVADYDRRLTKARKEAQDLAAAQAAIGTPDRDDQDGPIHSGYASLDQAAKHAVDNPQLSLYKLKTAAYKYSWALIPLSLPFIWILFPFRRGVGLYDHAIFATYSLSFMTLLASLGAVAAWAGVPTDAVWTVLILAPPIHMYRQMKGAYRLSRLGALWRTGLLLVFTLFTSALFAVLLLYLGLA